MEHMLRIVFHRRWFVCAWSSDGDDLVLEWRFLSGVKIQVLVVLNLYVVGFNIIEYGAS